MRRAIIATLILAAATVGANQMLDALFMARGRVAPLPTTDGLVLYWSMDSVSGTNVFDTFGDNDGTTVGTPLFDSAYGKYLDGVRLSGTNQYITGTVAVSYPFTLSIWVRPSISKDVALFGISHPSNSAQYKFIRRRADNAFSIAARDTGTNVSTDSKSTNYPNGSWYHVVGVFASATSRELYVNGVSVATSSTSVVLSGETVVSLGRLRATDSVLNMQGDADEASIWNRALSSNEVSEIYNNGAGRFYTP